MVDAECARTSEAPVFAKVRLKPDIYTTNEGKTIVEDEFLHFLSMKLRSLSQDEIVILATNTFDSEWIEMSKKTLFELCHTTQRNICHKGVNKDANNVKACLKVLNECGDQIPRFVSHYLDELPAVSFTSLDVCTLLRKMESLHAEISTLKRAVHLQTEVGEGLRAVTVDVNSRLCALEQRANQVCDRPDSCAEASVSTAEGAAGEGLEVHIGESTSPGERRTKSSSTVLPTPGSPLWSQVAKSGKRRRKDLANASSAGQPKPNPRKGVKPIVVGTGSSGSIKTIKTKLVSVFASRFSPDVDADTLRTYLNDKLGQDVTCFKISTVNTRYASFKVSAECNEVETMYNPELWPEGTFVRRYYEPRKAVVGAEALRAPGAAERSNV